MTPRRPARSAARVALVLAGLEIGLRLAGAAWDAAARRAAAGGDFTIICVGDSWTEGTSAPGGG